MALLTGSNKINTAVFISGTGSNLKSLIKFSKLKKSPITIGIIISNNPKSKGLKYAKINKIKKKVFNLNSTLFEKKAINELKKNNINLICLAGFMKILSKSFIKNFNGKILNIHPSLLPKYKGLNTHEKAIKNKDKGRNNTPAIIKIPALTSTKAITSVKASGCNDKIGN